ncbi:MAG: class I SAM-dependent methyltransferase [Ignavibacteriae bacterium]|nr:class I SAM-dependent methyltransferase [Ignavibacteriota bacterium]
MNDKKHWYDGIFYDKIIAPNQDKMFEQIKRIVGKDNSVLDIGCGTGRLAFQLSDHCRKIVGIDLSSKNISVAKSNHNGNFKNVEFVHGDIKKISSGDSEKFDFAILTYVIHEVPEKERLELLSAIKKVSNKIIIGDYITPTPNSFGGKLIVVVEYLAGKDHYNNFKNYVKNGGLDYLIKEANLKKISEIKNQPQTSHLVVLE